MAPIVYAVLISPIRYVSRFCIELSVGYVCKGGPSLGRGEGTHSIQVEPGQPIVRGLYRVEDGSIVTVQHHAHSRNHRDVPRSTVSLGLGFGIRLGASPVVHPLGCHHLSGDADGDPVCEGFPLSLVVGFDLKRVSLNEQDHRRRNPA